MMIKDNKKTINNKTLQKKVSDLLLKINKYNEENNNKKRELAIDRLYKEFEKMGYNLFDYL